MVAPSRSPAICAAPVHAPVQPCLRSRFGRQRMSPGRPRSFYIANSYREYFFWAPRNSLWAPESQGRSRAPSGSRLRRGTTQRHRPRYCCRPPRALRSFPRAPVYFFRDFPHEANMGAWESLHRPWPPEARPQDHDDGRQGRPGQSLLRRLAGRHERLDLRARGSCSHSILPSTITQRNSLNRANQGEAECQHRPRSDLCGALAPPGRPERLARGLAVRSDQEPLHRTVDSASRAKCSQRRHIACICHSDSSRAFPTCSSSGSTQQLQQQPSWKIAG
jgi:hypothetical protein